MEVGGSKAEVQLSQLYSEFKADLQYIKSLPYSTPPPPKKKKNVEEVTGQVVMALGY